MLRAGLRRNTIHHDYALLQTSLGIATCPQPIKVLFHVSAVGTNQPVIGITNSFFRSFVVFRTDNVRVLEGEQVKRDGITKDRLVFTLNEIAIAGNWQGVVFASTPSRYLDWQRAKSGPNSKMQPAARRGFTEFDTSMYLEKQPF